MSIRSCALESKAFLALKDAYDHREKGAAKARAKGIKVLGELGFDVPEEFVLAAGMFPVRIYADPEKSLEETDKYLEYSFEPVVRAQFEKIIDGTYGSQIDYLAIQVRDEFVIDLFKKQLEEWSGKEITDEAVREAGAVLNENRRALREMAQLRHGTEVRISGSEAMVIIGAGFFMDKKEHTELVKQVTEDAKSWPVLEGPRVFYTGANHEDNALYDKIEAAGLVIVGEDTDWGDRSYDRDYNPELPVIRGVVDRYLFREFSAKKAFVSQRVEALDREVNAAGAQGVIFYTNQYDEVATWDMPKQRKSLESRGIRHITFGRMQWPVSKNEGLDEKLAAFAQEMKGGAQ